MWPDEGNEKKKGNGQLLILRNSFRLLGVGKNT